MQGRGQRWLAMASVAVGMGCGGATPGSVASLDRMDATIADASPEAASAEAASPPDAEAAGDGGTCSVGATSATPAALGQPCISETESAPTFGGFLRTEVQIENGSFQCASRLCLIDHFQGRATCPYGQDSSGHGPDGGPCLTPGTCEPVQPIAGGLTVKAQCADRRAADTSICSCHCANAAGATDDDAGPYCTCPSGMTCTQVFPAGLGALSGAFCTKTSAPYDAADACATLCNPVTAPCP